MVDKKIRKKVKEITQKYRGKGCVGFMDVGIEAYLEFIRRGHNTERQVYFLSSSQASNNYWRAYYYATTINNPSPPLLISRGIL